MANGFDVGSFLRVRQTAFGLRQRQRQQEQAGQLGGECFGGGHTNLNAGAGHIGVFALAHHGAGGHVANRQRLRHAQALRMAQRGQGVGSLTALGDGDDEGAGVGHRFAVAVFAGNLHLAGHFGYGFDPVLGHTAAVVAGAAGQDQHIVDRLESGISPVAKQLGRDAHNAL